MSLAGKAEIEKFTVKFELFYNSSVIFFIERIQTFLTKRRV